MTLTVTLTGYSTADQARTEAAAARRGALAAWQARCVQGYIAANLHTTIRMVDLCRVVQFGPYQFRRAFKERFGCTPQQYVIRRRVERAQSLMLLCDDSLSQISAECGFVDAFHFSNWFWRIVGERPGTWRRKRAR